MHFYPSSGYTHCRSGSDSGLHRRNSRRDVGDVFDSGDSTLSDLDESESGSGSGVDGDPNLPYPNMPPYALRYLSQTTRPRSWCLALISNPWFERVSIMVILLNCVTLGMYKPCSDNDKCDTTRCLILQRFDEFIFAFFSLEMTIKMVAMDVWGPRSYLADSWNWLDLFIVVAGAVEYGLPSINNLNLSPVRTIRVLRPLRAINRIPSMRILVMLLLDTLPMLGNVLLLCFFVFFIFGIVGVQLWQGVLRQRCYLSLPVNVSKPLELSEEYRAVSAMENFYKHGDTDYICSTTDHGMHSCDNLPPYKNGTIICNLTIEEKRQPQYINNDNVCINWNQYYSKCGQVGDNPFQNTISFDNIGLAWISIFLVISLEGWTEIMYYVQDGHSFWDWIYFVLLIVIGSFFMINLCLVVIATQFSETKKREMERMRLERKRFQSSSTLASSTNNSEPSSCYAEIVRYIAHLWRRNKRKLLKKIRLYRVQRDQRRDRKIISGETIRLNCARRHHPNCPRLRQNQQSQSLPSTRPVSIDNSMLSIETSSRDQQPQQRSNEDVELASIVPKRPSVLRVSSISNQEVTSNNNESPTNALSPPCIPNNRRRSSVMFSGVVVLHGENNSPSSNSSVNLLSTNIDKKNVCSSEKTTQAGDGNIWQQTTTISNHQQQLAQECNDLLNGEPLTCQELLALGAINAALPTGQIVLDTFFNSLSKGMTNRQCKTQTGEEIYLQQLPDDDYSCCADLWHCESEYKNEKRSKLYIISCLIVKGMIKFLKMLRRHIKTLVEHKLFQHGILLAILSNTLSMGIEHHNQPPLLTQMVEYTNIVFSAIFAIEMLLKIIAEGPFGYISNGFNVFDGVIVVLSAIELFKNFTDVNGIHTDSGLSVLRTFRLLRILKLVRFMPNLRRQLFVMLRTMDNVAVFFSLLILFIFIFSILGMNIFGCQFCKTYNPVNNKTCTTDSDQDKDRKNFDSLLWALVTVFQILTQEDWNIVLANGMDKTSHWAALYFVALMTFGNYVLFNLLVAILVEGFSSERNERREREQRELARRKMSCILEGNLNVDSEESSRSLSSSSGSYIQETKNCWRSAEELRKPNSHKPLLRCDCVYLEPKCNKQKESMRGQPFRQPSPPVITHTAATPQDSPNTTLDDIPEFRYNVTSVTCDYPASGSDTTTAGASLSECVQKTPSLSLLKPPTLSPPPLTFRHFERPPPPDDHLHTPTGKIVIHNEKIGSRTMTFSEKVLPAPVATTQTKIDNNNTNCKNNNSQEKIQRRCSWKLNTSRASLRRKKNRSGSDSEAVPLNNGRDHSQCNGDGITRHASLRNDSLLQSTVRIQNDTQKDTPNNKSANGFSPQNSIRSRSNTYSAATQKATVNVPTLTRHNSLTKSPTMRSKQNVVTFKSALQDNNDGSGGSNVAIASTVQDTTTKSITLLRGDRRSPRFGIVHRVRLMFETGGCMKDKDDYSLYLFAPDNKFRLHCIWIVDQKWFDNVVLLFIAMNCITLAMERPNIPPDSIEKMFLKSCNYIFSVVFATEMFVKVVATGMCYGPNAYFTSGWNIMDGSLVIISLIDIVMFLLTDSTSRIFGILRVFRLLRSLRPLRVINRAPGLKLVVQTLLSSLRPIGNIVLICFTFFIIFGILGVQLFKGTFFHCVGPNITGVITREDCEQREDAKWENEKYNFDNLLQALMSLFVLSSRDGWVNIMYTGLDAVGEGFQPQVNYSEWRLLYFISFILLVGFFVLNMFVGVVVENFHRCREEQEREERIRRAAKRALQLEKRRRKMNEPPYYRNYAPWRLFVHNVVTSKYFDLAIAAVIGLNVITMATESYKMKPILQYILRIFNYFFTAVFIIESVMKLIALGFVLYLKEKWNQLDIFIVILSIVGIVLDEIGSNIVPINPTVLRVIHVMRIARVLKLLKMAKGIRALLDTVMQALPQVGNLGLLFFLLFFIFAALGVELFGRLDCKEIQCEGLGEHAHFENFGMAFLTLFRVATGDNWNGIMKDTLAHEPCDTKEDCIKNCCIFPFIAPIFFVIFVLMAQFVLVNVVVAVLMKHLEESHKHLEEEQDIDTQLEREFQEKQELEERRELCLALQMDQECQMRRKPLTKVLSLPSNFTYNPPGTKVTFEMQPSQTLRRQTMHSHQPIMMANLDDIRNIDESLSDIYSIQENKMNDNLERNCNLRYDEIITLSASDLSATPSVKYNRNEQPLKRINETNESNNKRLLSLPMESLTLSKLYGSTKQLFMKQQPPQQPTEEETPFLLNVAPSGGGGEMKMPKHDSEESVHRIITERRKLDEKHLRDINQKNIFDMDDVDECSKMQKDNEHC